MQQSATQATHGAGAIRSGGHRRSEAEGELPGAELAGRATKAPTTSSGFPLPVNRSFSARFWTAAAEQSGAAAFGETQRRGCTRPVGEAPAREKAVASHAQSKTLARRQCLIRFMGTSREPQRIMDSLPEGEGGSKGRTGASVARPMRAR